MLGAAENAVWERHNKRTGGGFPVLQQTWRPLHQNGSLTCRSGVTPMCVCIVQMEAVRWHSSEDCFPPTRPHPCHLSWTLHATYKFRSLWAMNPHPNLRYRHVTFSELRYSSRSSSVQAGPSGCAF